MHHLPQTFDHGFHGDNPWPSKLTYRPLGSTGLHVSTLSYGGSSLGGFYGDVERQEAVDTIQESIKSGINFLDTSPWYGDSESIIGQALESVTRHTYHLATKVGRNFTPSWENRFDFSAAAVLKNVETSLQLLGVPYLDLIQVHDLEFCHDKDILLKETIPALEAVVKAGKAKFIGITGYDLNFLEQIVQAVPAGTISTVLSYARYNFHDQSLLHSSKVFVDNHVGIINAAPLAMGLLSTLGPPSWHPASAVTKEAARVASKLALDKGSTLEKASLQYSLHGPEPIATTLVSMPTRKILQDNLLIVTTKVNPQEILLQDEILKEFESRQAGHWEGIELAEYKDWRKKC